MDDKRQFIKLTLVRSIVALLSLATGACPVLAVDGGAAPGPNPKATQEAAPASDAAPGGQSDAAPASNPASTPTAGPALHPASRPAALPSANPASPQDATAQSAVPPELVQRIASLEAKLFGETHEGAAPEKRLARIEKFVYGATAAGTIDERVKKLEAGMTQKNPDGSAAAPLPNAASVPVIPPQGQTVPLPPVPDSSTVNDAPREAATGETKAYQPPRDTPAPEPPGEPLKLSLVKYRDIEQPRRVIDELNEAIDSDPSSDGDMYFQRAKAYMELEDYSRAISDLTSAIQKDPMKYQYYLARACILNKQGKPFMAQKDISRARFVNPFLPADIHFDKDAGGDQ